MVQMGYASSSVFFEQRGWQTFIFRYLCGLTLTTSVTWALFYNIRQLYFTKYSERLFSNVFSVISTKLLTYL
jgi:hypothetical protein